MPVNPPHSEESIARALRALPAAPDAWVAAAKELPALRGRLDDLVARAEADAAFRDAVLTDLEQAVRDAGLAPDPVTLSLLQHRLSGGGAEPPPG
jgi:type VI protein secretion system component VasF